MWAFKLAWYNFCSHYHALAQLSVWRPQLYMWFMQFCEIFTHLVPTMHLFHASEKFSLHFQTIIRWTRCCFHVSYHGKLLTPTSNIHAHISSHKERHEYPSLFSTGGPTFIPQLWNIHCLQDVSDFIVVIVPNRYVSCFVHSLNCISNFTWASSFKFFAIPFVQSLICLNFLRTSSPLAAWSLQVQYLS